MVQRVLISILFKDENGAYIKLTSNKSADLRNRPYTRDFISLASYEPMSMKKIDVSTKH